jgi:hypothetical protein
VKRFSSFWRRALITSFSASASRTPGVPRAN